MESEKWHLKREKVASIRGIIRRAGWVRWMAMNLPLLNQGAGRDLCEKMRFKQRLEGEDALAGRCSREVRSRLWEQLEQRPKCRSVPSVSSGRTDTSVVEVA